MPGRAPSAPSALLEVRGLGKDYGRRTAVGEVDLAIAPGEIVGLLGPNGAGKTTTISMIAGVLTPSRGHATLAGHRIGAHGDAGKRALGLVPQDLALYDPLTATQNLTFFGKLYGLHGAALRERIAWALGVVGLRERADDHVKTYSGGMKRRLNLAAGILHRPRLLILDEPTVGVDPQSRHHIFDTVRGLRADGLAVLYTSHYMEEVEVLCDRVAIMDDGAIVAAGTLAELTARHGGAGKVELELAGDDGALMAAKAMAARHGPIDGGGTRLRLPRPRALAPLLADVESAGATVVAMHTVTADLQAVFLAVTGHTLRD